MKKRKLGRKLLSFLLTLAMVVGLMPGMSLTAYAVEEYAATWSSDQTIASSQTITGVVAVTSDITLTINDGVTLTVNGGIDVNNTLTIAGGGNLVVTYNESDLNSSSGICGNIIINGGEVEVTGPNNGRFAVEGIVTVNNGSVTLNGADGTEASYPGNGIYGDLIVNGGTVTVTGGDADPTNSESGGASGVAGDITVSAGSVTITGGNGAGYLYCLGGNGVTRDVTVTGGSVTITGGTGGEESNPEVGTAIGWGTITGDAEESDDGNTWSAVSGGYSEKRYVRFGATSSTVEVTGVTLAPSTAQTIDVGGKVSFTATVQPDNATDKTVKWSVGGTNAGAVKLYTDADCTTEVGTDATSTLTVYAKGISAGSATVTATSNADSSKSASCDVTVNAAAAQYYVVSNINDWSPEDSYLMTYDEANSEFQLLGVSFSADDLFKVVKNEDSSLTWYPEGMGNDYTITADGTYNIHFRPDGQGGDGWYEGCIKVEAAAAPAATYVVAGSDADIFGTAWDASNEDNTMSLAADGTYQKTYTVSQAYDDINLKVVKNYSWVESYGDAQGYNVIFSLPSAGSFTVIFNPATGVVSVRVAHTHDDISFTAWTATDSMPTAAGNYYLANDVTIDSTWNVPTGTTNLCLNGHGIIMSGTNRVITVSSESTLNLYDCGTEAVHKFTVPNPSAGGAGLATVNDSLESGYQTFTGGYITGGNAGQGGGVYVDGGTFHMAGGNIIGNKATASGYNDGGGVTLANNPNSRFVMTGGAIQYNTSVGRGGGLGIENNATVELSGDAKITYNCSNNDDWGGGISSFGTLNISGNVKISNNKGGSALHPQQGSFTISGAPVIFDNEVLANILSDDVMIDVTGTLTEGAKIGIYWNNDKVFTNSTDKSFNDASKFVSDNPDLYVVKDADGQLSLRVKYAVTLDRSSATVAAGSAQELTAAVTPQNATDKKVVWSVSGDAVKLYTDEDCTIEVGTEATENLTVYAKGISAGSATVTATSNADSTKSASCDVTVPDPLADVKTSAKADLDTLLTEKNQNDYDAADWTTLTQAITDGKTAIDNATTNEAVTTAKNNAVDAVNAVKTKAQKELDNAKTSAKADLDTLLTEKNQNDYDAADWTTLTQAITDGKTAIDNATTTEDVTTAKNNAVDAVNAVKTKAQKALENAKTTAKNTVTAVNANDYIAADQQTVTDAKTTALAAIEAATTEEEVTTALNNFNNAIASCTTQVVADQIAQVMSEVSAKTGSDMTYTGNPIQLINTPTTALPAGYTMKYAVTTENVKPTDDNLYTTDNYTATDAGTYYVWFKVVDEQDNIRGGVSSVEVTIIRPTEIVTQPAAAKVIRGSKAKFSVEATGDDLTYVWQISKDGVNWSNSTASGCDTDKITFRATKALNGKYYRCVITGAGGVVISDAVKLTTLAVINGQPGDAAATIGSDATFSVSSRSSAATYQWQVSTDGGETWKKSSAEGCDTDHLTVNVKSAKYGEYLFRCKVTNGTWVEYSKAAGIDIVTFIVKQPETIFASEGDKVKLYVKATGIAPTYQWEVMTSSGKWVNSTAPGNATNIITFKATAVKTAYKWRCKITDGDTVLYSNVVSLVIESGQYED